MRLLLDMNLSPDLCAPLGAAGHDCIHWSTVGDEGNSRVVLTHDLDFGAILAATKATGPSVVQIRTDDVLSPDFAKMTIDTLNRFAPELASGALVVVDLSRARVRILPIGKQP
jgi:predicted nuclease of predicted toxin-antitoxin system